MTSKYTNDPMQEVFIFETTQQLEQMEQSVIMTESLGGYSNDTINEIFRIMHTIKSSAAMMLLNNISEVAHSTEDLFYFIREDKPEKIDIATLSDIVLEGIDFMKVELKKVKSGDEADGNPAELIGNIKSHLEVLKHNNSIETVLNTQEDIKQKFYISSCREAHLSEKNLYRALIKFEENCGMENIRAFTIVKEV